MLTAGGVERALIEIDADEVGTFLRIDSALKVTAEPLLQRVAEIDDWCGYLAGRRFPGFCELEVAAWLKSARQ